MSETVQNESIASVETDYSKKTKDELIKSLKEADFHMGKANKRIEDLEKYIKSFEEAALKQIDGVKADKDKLVNFYENRHTNLCNAIRASINLTEYSTEKEN